MTHMRNRGCGRVLLLTAALLPLAPVRGLAQGLMPEQVVRVDAVSSVAMSPDGKHLAYTVTAARDSAEQRGLAHSELYTVEAAGDHPNAIVRRPDYAAHPVWSPDGAQLAFIGQLGGAAVRQVYAVPRSGGEPRALTRSATSVSAFEWLPDGGIVYIASGAADPEIAERQARGHDQIVESERLRPAGLWIQRATGDATRLVPARLNVVNVTVTADGATVAFQATEQLGADAELMYRKLYVVPAAGGEPRVLTETSGKLGAMAWSPDGAHLALLAATSFNDPLPQSVFVVSATDGAKRNLTEGFEGSATSVTWLDAQNVAFVATHGTKTTLNRVLAAGGRIQRIAGGGAHIFQDVSFDAKRQTFAAAAHTSRHPAEIYVGNPRSGALQRLSHHNTWLTGVVLGQQETIEWRSSDGWRIEGVLIRPVGYAEGMRYPLAILPHGGPEGVSLDGWVTNPLYPAQVLAARGYVVLMPNYRGSGGRGVAFSKADHRDLGGREFDDVIAGIDHLVAQGLVDNDRVGISGTSYGGYFSAWAATRHSDRFKAAIPFAGLTNWLAFTYTTDIPVEMSVVHWDLPIFGNELLYWERSPVAHVGRANTPTLIGHGLADDRVHPEQSLELYNALKLKGVPVELVTYPREPHGLRERAHQLDYMYRITEWLDRWLKPGRPVS